MDTPTIVSIISAGVAAVSAGVALRQAAGAAESQRIANQQAKAAETHAAAAKEQNRIQQEQLDLARGVAVPLVVEELRSQLAEHAQYRDYLRLMSKCSDMPQLKNGREEPTTQERAEYEALALETDARQQALGATHDLYAMCDFLENVLARPPCDTVQHEVNLFLRGAESALRCSMYPFPGISSNPCRCYPKLCQHLGLTPQRAFGGAARGIS